MKQGLTLEETAREIERQSSLREDYVADTRELLMLNGAELSLPIGENGLGQDRHEFAVSPVAHRQIGERLGIPAKFYDRLREPEGKLSDEAQAELRRLLDTNVNTLFRAKPERRMVRTFKGDDGGRGLARAFLSDRYRRLDNDQVAEAVLPILADIPDVRIESSGLTERNFYLKAIAPRVQGEVKLNDVVHAGVVIRNSEVGHGSLSVQPLVFRLKCLNGMIVAEATRHYHVGRTVEGEDETYRVLSDATAKLDDQAFFAKLGDVVKAAVSEAQFEQIVAQLRDSTGGQQIESPADAVEKLAKRFTLGEDEKKSVLKHLTLGGDLSKWGALNAVTATANEVESYDRATELEAVGGHVLALPNREWAAIAA